MITYREMVYMVLDLLKAMSDDFYYTEDHILFLLDKYRAFLLKQKYRTPKSVILNSNFMTVNFIIPSEGNFDIPGVSILEIATPRIQNSLSWNYCSPERFPFVGNNKFLKSINYFTIDLGVFKTKVIKEKENASRGFAISLDLKAVFESPTSVYKYLEKDPIDEIFPLEEALISPLLEIVSKDLSQNQYKPEDKVNNATDDFGKIGMVATLNQKQQ